MGASVSEGVAAALVAGGVPAGVSCCPVQAVAAAEASSAASPTHTLLRAHRVLIDVIVVFLSL
jgi:hypothetical protein